MHRGVEVLGADRRQVHEVRAAVARAACRRALSAPAAGRAAVDRDLEVARHEPRRELREERLVPSVAPGNATRADERHSQLPHSGSAGRRNQRPMACVGTLRRRWTNWRWATSSRR